MKLNSFLLPVSAFCACFTALAWPVEIPLGEESLLGLRDCVELADGSVVLSLAGPFEDPVIACFDTDGQVLWQKKVLERGGSSRAFESGGYLVPLEDGFAAAFHSEPRATGVNTDVAVIRMNGSGDVLWTYVLGLEDELNWMCRDLILCRDGGLLVTGCPGTMLPGGYAFKLSSEGALQWITPSDVIEGFLYTAVELPDGDFLCLTEEYSGTLTLQLISIDGAILDRIEVLSDGLLEADDIHLVNGSPWVSFSYGNGFMDAFRLDGEFAVDRAVSAVFPSGVQVRFLDMSEKGFLVAGNLEDDGFLAIACPDGRVIWQDTVDTGGDEVFDGAFFKDDGILAYGSVFDQYGMTSSVLVDFRDVPESINLPD
ncbi:MAG: hypothetical protein JXA64_05820 [Candidatus Fermentibacteraceae bacterium]|nr:hypothetical protein [Candidatus Fermentibacteraceae bacterium]MBN2608613.1 hypothetical protein [Candidatus Fermentibacteraceae bacterium]